MIASELNRSRLQQVVLFTAITLLATTLFLGKWIPLAALLAAGLGVIALLVITRCMAQRNLQVLFVVWALICPFGYALIQFPRPSTIVTWDRIAVGFASCALIWTWLKSGNPVPKQFRKTALLWLAFLAVALFSIMDLSGSEFLGALRLLVEAFVFPGVLFLFVVRCFSVRRNLAWIHLMICVVSIYLAGLGLAEVALGTDLIPTSQTRNVYYAGTSDFMIIRANGPYGTTSTYATVGLINFLFLIFLRRALPPEVMTRGRRMLHMVAICSAVVVALLPMFRMLALTAVAIALIAWLKSQSKEKFAKLSLLVVSLAVGALLLKLAAPDIFEERVTDTANVYSRIAEYQQALAVFAEHPVLGVGLNQFTPAVQDRWKYLFSYKGEPSLDYPHSMFLAILAETGVVGFLFFFAAQAGFLTGLKKLLRDGHTRAEGLSWTFALYMFVAYWGMNVDLTSGYYDELNVWYFVVLAFVVKYGVEEYRKAERERAMPFIVNTAVDAAHAHR